MMVLKTVRKKTERTAAVQRDFSRHGICIHVLPQVVPIIPLVDFQLPSAKHLRNNNVLRHSDIKSAQTGSSNFFFSWVKRVETV